METRLNLAPMSSMDTGFLSASAFNVAEIPPKRSAPAPTARTTFLMPELFSLLPSI
jgi:hypothetical protein